MHTGFQKPAPQTMLDLSCGGAGEGRGGEGENAACCILIGCWTQRERSARTRKHHTRLPTEGAAIEANHKDIYVWTYIYLQAGGKWPTFVRKWRDPHFLFRIKYMVFFCFKQNYHNSGLSYLNLRAWWRRQVRKRSEAQRRRVMFPRGPQCAEADALVALLCELNVCRDAVHLHKW